MAKFIYNNAKNTSTGYTSFELNCRYHPRVSYDEDFDLRSKSRNTEELSSELQELMTICQQNFYYAQELQNRAHNKSIKPQSYALGDKVWLSSKHLKTKWNCKLEAKFLGPFRVLYPVGRQVYKLELPKRWRIYDIFYVSLLEQDITKKGRVNDMQLEFEAGDNKEYEVDGIGDSAVHANESAGQLPGLYYLVLWKSYREEENTWEPTLAIQHLQKLVTAYHNDNSKKPTATSGPVNTVPPMARPFALPRPIAKPTTAPTKKQGQPAGPTAALTKKQGRPVGSTNINKRKKKS